MTLEEIVVGLQQLGWSVEVDGTGLHAKRPGAVTKDWFEAWWQAYPNRGRRVGKAKCRSTWAKKRLDLIGDQIVQHTLAMGRTSSWQDGFEPATLTYLNQGRWEDSLPDDGARRSSARTYMEDLLSEHSGFSAGRDSGTDRAPEDRLRQEVRADVGGVQPRRPGSHLDHPVFGKRPPPVFDPGPTLDLELPAHPADDRGGG